jgi:exodeoxyribonuclease VII small subunit
MPEKKTTETTSSFEGILASLQAIVEKLEVGNLPLSETIDRFEEGTRLADHARKLIEEADLRITVLSEDDVDDESEDGAYDDDGSDIPF